MMKSPTARSRPGSGASTRMQVRVKATELEEIDRAAERRGLDRSAFVRSAIAAALAPSPEASPEVQ